MACQSGPSAPGPNTKVILLEAADGPEGIEIYTDDEEGIVDWACTFPSVYVNISINGAMAKFGPFTLPKIYKDIEKAVSPSYK
jgi:hypothetical protein